MTITGMTRFVQQNYKVQNSHLTLNFQMALCRQRVMLTHIVRREWILQVERIFAALSLLTRALQIR